MLCFDVGRCVSLVIVAPDNVVSASAAGTTLTANFTITSA